MKKNTQSADFFCKDQIDVITKFAVKTNVVIKTVHCIYAGYNIPDEKTIWFFFPNNICCDPSFEQSC